VIRFNPDRTKFFAISKPTGESPTRNTLA